MRFRDLSIGDVFEFDHSGLPIAHGLARGPWVKRSARKYLHVDDVTATGRRRAGGFEHKVGSINAKVVALDDENPCPVANVGKPAPADSGSWIGRVRAWKGELLLGGKPEVQSSRFGTAVEARAWVLAVVEGNSQAGRGVGSTSVEHVKLPPEV